MRKTIGWTVSWALYLDRLGREQMLFSIWPVPEDANDLQ